ncbi:hypothetical protein Sjap_022253 [Stephania japonica]|uniref:Uncharacterized protein n=1 Tax=Stephania japonica TaxID=461633 RepID=A0AAP0ENK8_9MAGN
MKAGKNIRRGFMCQSPASTAVCMTGDHRSVIVPRRRQCANATSVDHSMLMVNKYSKLAEPNGSRFSSAYTNRPMTLSSALNDDRVKVNAKENEWFYTLLPPPQIRHSSYSGGHESFSALPRLCWKIEETYIKMEGVTSFSIDLETKRVTVTGHVSAVGVLESISKVKRAEFWSS